MNIKISGTERDIVADDHGIIRMDWKDSSGKKIIIGINDAIGMPTIELRTTGSSSFISPIQLMTEGTIRASAKNGGVSEIYGKLSVEELYIKDENLHIDNSWSGNFTINGLTIYVKNGIITNVT